MGSALPPKRAGGGLRQARARRLRWVLRMAAIVTCVLCLVLVASRLVRRSHRGLLKRRGHSSVPALLLPPYPRVYDAPPAASPVHRAAADGGDRVRTVIATIGADASAPLCAQWVSSALTGVPTTTAGWGATERDTQDTLSLLSQTVAAKELRDWDVLVYVSQSSLFTGVDLQPFVDEFVRHSAAHPDDLDVREIRQGTRVAPVRFATSPSCAAKLTLANASACEAAYFGLDAAVEARAATDQFRYLPHVNATDGRTNEPFLQSGFFVARVWAFKELVAAHGLLKAKLPRHGERLDAVQSVLTALYLDLRWDEVQLGLLAPASRTTTRPTVNQFGLHYGLIDLWHSRPPVAHLHTEGTSGVRIDASLYGLPFQTSMYYCSWSPAKTLMTLKGIFQIIPSPAQHVHDVPLRYTHPQGVSTVPLAPSLLGWNPRLIDRTADGTFHLSFPSLVDVPSRRSAYCRVEAARFLGWYLALDLKADQRNVSAALASSATVEVVRGAKGVLTQVSIGEQCSKWIHENIVNGERIF